MSTIEMDELRTCFAKKCEELEKAQACAAEMRGILEHGVHFLSYEERLNHALSSSCGVGLLSPEKVKELNDEIGNLRERAAHAEQAAMEMAEKVDELKAQNQLMRESLQRIATNPSSIASQHIARETLDKLKGQ